MLVSFIIPAYDEEDFLPKSIASVKSAMDRLGIPGTDYEMIVVDNNSTDGTARVAEENGARVVFEKHNCIAAARNAGAREAEGGILIFVDADTLVNSALVRKVLDVIAAGKVCGGGCRVKFDVPRLPLPGEVFLWMWNTLTTIKAFAAGSFVFCLRDAWRDTGGFDERFYASEEMHFSLALHKWGRARGMKFIILDENVITSARKFEWFGTYRLMSNMLILTLLPFLLRNKRFCKIWYSRPAGK